MEEREEEVPIEWEKKQIEGEIEGETEGETEEAIGIERKAETPA